MSPRERRVLRKIERELAGDPTLRRLAGLFPGPDRTTPRSRMWTRPITLLVVAVAALTCCVVGAVCDIRIMTTIALTVVVTAGALLVTNQSGTRSDSLLIVNR